VLALVPEEPPPQALRLAMRAAPRAALENFTFIIVILT
jgi:hypothetical protein